MIKKNVITKQDLMEKYHITDVKENGDIYVNGKLRNFFPGPKRTFKNGKEPEYPYMISMFTDFSLPVKERKQKLLLQHVVVWAWFHDVSPADMEIDHINNDGHDNRIDNLRLVTQAENKKRKTVSRNQYNWMLSDAEILARRAQQDRVYNRYTGKAEKNKTTSREYTRLLFTKNIEDLEKMVYDVRIRLKANRDTYNRYVELMKKAKEEGNVDDYKYYNAQKRAVKKVIKENVEEYNQLKADKENELQRARKTLKVERFIRSKGDVE